MSRTSLASLFAPPVAGFRPSSTPPGGLKPQPHRALTADIAKTALADLASYRPTHLIVDFIDERFDLLSVGDSRITHSWELEASGYRQKPALRGARAIPRLSEAAERLWLEGAAEFAAVVRATPLRNARLILHSARWATTQRTAEGQIKPLSDAEILPGVPADIAQHNAMLARYEAAFTALAPPLAQVAAPEHRQADAGHEWGLSPFHYTPDYYAAIWRQLDDLGVRAG